MSQFLTSTPVRAADISAPAHRQLYYAGAWQEPHGGYAETFNPANGESLGRYAVADATDVDAATRAAHAAFRTWRTTRPQVRADALREIARIIRTNGEELAMLDAINCGNPVRALLHDIEISTQMIEYFAGLVHEQRGCTIPMEPDVINMTVREPFGVCARIVAYNHPLMFTASRMAPAVAAGNTVIMKPPVQAPLSALRLMELIDGVLPPGVLNVLTGGQACGEALVQHPLIPKVTLIGSIPTGKAIARGAADQLKHVSLELGGKNALIIYPDADMDRAIAGAVSGMCFAWCGQACSSTTRLFVHESVYDRVVSGVVEGVKAFRPGIPTDMNTTMGAIVSKEQYDKIMGYIELGKQQGARLVAGGKHPEGAHLAEGYFIEPTVFADVTPQMRIAQEEIFGPVLSILKWSDEDSMFEDVNGVEYGLAAGIYTTNLATAHRAAGRVEAGYVWVNNAARHFFPAPFGGTTLMQSTTRGSYSHTFVVRCADGAMLAVQLSSLEKFWIALTQAVAAPHLAADKRFASRAQRIRNFSQLTSELSKCFVSQPRAYWLDALTNAGVPHSEVRRVDEVLADPELAQLGSFSTVAHAEMGPVTCIERPVLYDGTRPATRLAPPVLGEHTQEVMRELGIDPPGF